MAMQHERPVASFIQRTLFVGGRAPSPVLHYQRIIEAVAAQAGSATEVRELVQGQSELDPQGLPASTPGAKLDSGKVDVTRGCLHYFPRALVAVAELSQIGAKKYSWKGWEKVADGIHRYAAALGRHELKIEDDYDRKDPDTGVLEATAVAWNALARLELVLREKK